MTPTRRHFIASALAAPLLTAPAAFASGTRPVVEVIKSPTCGCCTAWIEHLAANGFDVRAEDVSQDQLSAAKRSLGIGPELQSCHTAMVDGYVIEGHVPAGDIHRLLGERPEARGLSVPGMPIGSPGMEMGDERERYDVILFRADGSARVYATHGVD